MFLNEGRGCIHLEKIWLNRWAPVIALGEALGEIISQLKGISEEGSAMEGHKKESNRGWFMFREADKKMEKQTILQFNSIVTC